jgi:hypothetical protein
MWARLAQFDGDTADLISRTLVVLGALVLLSTASAGPAASQLGLAQCSPASVEGTVRAFVTAFNSGRITVAEGYFAEEPMFEWFSVNPPGTRLGSRARDRATLRAYLASRARVHEKLRVTQLSAGYNARQKNFDFGGKLIRTSDEKRTASSRPDDFKGAAVCRGGGSVLFVWSM